MSESQPQIYEFEEFRIEVPKRLLTKGGASVPLSPKAFDTLLYLVRNGGRIVGKDELLREVWTDSIVEENNLTQNISILRRTFGEKPGEQRFIITVPGYGYRFVPEVNELASFSGYEPAGAEPEESGNSPGAVVEQALTDGTQHSQENDFAKSSFLPLADRKIVAVVALFSVVVLSVAAYYIWRPNEKSGQERVKSLAVLPFKPLVAENRNEALELGLADSLISKLSAGDEINVLPLSAIRRYTSVEQDALTAGRELAVDSVLDGTIQNWGDRVRISARLSRSSDGKQLWTGQFDEKFTDIFAIQDAISDKVAAALKIRQAGNEKKRATSSIEAYQLYMKGRYQTAKGTPPDLISSISYFQQAIELDREYALAYTGLAQAYGVLGIFAEMPPSEAFVKARAAEHKALEIDDSLGEAHLSLCMGLFWYDWDWAGAERECLRALEIDPNNADFHGYYAQVLSSTGRHEDALAEIKRSLELNPLNLSQSALEGQFLLHAGRADEALDRLQKLALLEPNFPFTHLFAASAYIEKGMLPEAIAESRKELELTRTNNIPFGAFALARSGRRDEAKAELRGLLTLSATKYVSPYNIALVYNALDEREKALEWLENGYRMRDPKMTFLKVEPKWNSLRDEPRFGDMIKRMKL
jgi:DNA-binding winged helix-turn-helix (wHTH) protein/TolB-like protein/Flp pilus assembly protein TadD